MRCAGWWKNGLNHAKPPVRHRDGLLIPSGEVKKKKNTVLICDVTTQENGLIGGGRLVELGVGNGGAGM